MCESTLGERGWEGIKVKFINFTGLLWIQNARTLGGQVMKTRPWVLYSTSFVQFEPQLLRVAIISPILQREEARRGVVR